MMECVTYIACFPPVTLTPPPSSLKATATSPVSLRGVQICSSRMVYASLAATQRCVDGMEGTVECVHRAVSLLSRQAEYVGEWSL